MNLGKIKILECRIGKDVSVEANVDPCGVCGKKTKTNCIQCKSCQK